MNPRTLGTSFGISSAKIILTVALLFAIGTSVSSAEVAVESLLPKDIREGWTLDSGPEVYTKKTLFRHINGQAELFFKYGFQKSAFAIYQEKKNEKNQIELDVYDMGNVLHAFGIFSRFRNEDRPAGIGLDSYFDDRSLIFYKGQYFIMLYATESDSSMLKEWAMMISSRISDPSSPPKEIDYFPKEGLQLGSIQYFPEGLLGYQFLKRGFQGTYIGKDQVKVEDKAKAKVEVKDEDKVKVEVKAEDQDKTTADGKEFHLFLAIFNNSQDAAYALKTYRDSLSKKGKVHSGIPTPFEPNALRGEDPYRGKVIVVPKGFYLAGIIGFENPKSAEKLLEEFVKNIR
jgi:hypothetical protein